VFCFVSEGHRFKWVRDHDYNYAHLDVRSSRCQNSLPALPPPLAPPMSPPPS
jgi:hypothetical protein